jgi:predicted ester cyclase
MDPLTKLMQRYCFAYTATHDFSVADEIMDDDYVFYMGEHRFQGRESSYKPAADRQFLAYPGLGFTVHDFFSNGDRCAMFFSEHGRSVQHDCEVAWHGASLYRWNGVRLTECRIEQDYQGRRRQFQARVADPVGRPAHAPWSGPVREPDVESEIIVAEWLKGGGLLRSRIGSLDDERCAPSIERVQLRDERIEILDLFSAGRRVAFNIRSDGIYSGGLATLSRAVGVQASLYATGMVDVHDGAIGPVRAITDRYTMERRILVSQSG